MKHLFFVCMVAAALGAHEYWIGGDGVLHQGHLNNEASEHQHIQKGEVRQYPSELYCRRNGKMDVRHGSLGVSEQIDTACDSVMVVLNLGQYAKTPYGIVAAEEANSSMVIRSWESIEYIKRLNALSDFAPMGKGFELSLTEDPSALEEGDKMRLLATFGGRPMRGAVVAYDGKVVGTTDDEGRINVRIRHTGLQLVRATYRQPLERAAVGERLHNATLNLEVR